MRVAPGPTEAQEQMQVVRWLEFRGYLFTHTGNGEKRDARTGVKLRRMGLRRGAPDLLIFSPPPNHRDMRGCAIEMKRADSGRLSSDQEVWLASLRALGWAAMCCHGARDAIAQLQALGY